MSAAHSLIAHFLNFSVLSFTGRILLFLYGIKLANLLGPEKSGLYNSATVYISMFAILSNLGLSNFLIQTIAKNRDLAIRTISEITGLRIIMALLASAFACAISYFYYEGQMRILTMVFASTIILDAISVNIESFFQGMEKFAHFYWSSFTVSIITMSAGLYTVYLTQNVNILIAVMILCAGFRTLLNTAVLIFSGKKFSITFPADFLLYLKKSLPFGCITLLGLIYFRIDMLMLQSMQGNEAAGQYSVAYKLINMLTMLSSVYTTIFFPVFTRIYSDSPLRLARISSAGIKFMFILALPVAAGTSILAAPVTRWLFAPEYWQSSTALAILVWAAGMVFLNTVLYNVLYACEKQFYVMFCLLSAALFNVSANFYAIQKWSYFGAAGTTVACEILTFILAAYAVIKYAHISVFFSGFFKIVFSAACMSICVYAAAAHLHPILCILLGIISYALCIGIFYPFSADDEQALLKIPVLIYLVKMRRKHA